MDVLLIGSSFSALPMLFDLQKRGAHVTVVGKYEDDPCHAYADASLHIDYSDPNGLLEVCRANSFDGIVPSCNDYAYVAAAKVAAQLGYPGFDSLETTEILHEKDRFRQFCATVGVPAPRLYGEVTGLERRLPMQQIDSAVLVKPVDSFSGRGVKRVDKPEDLPEAIDYALAESRSNRAVVEEFVEGSLHSHTAFVSGGQIVWYEIVDEFCEVYAYQVDRSGYPSRLQDTTRTAVHESLSALVRAMGMADGLLHTQFIASKERFWIIECMRRCPGDLYGHHFHFAEGRDYTHEYVSPFLGIAPKTPAATKPLRRVERRIISVQEAQPMFGVTLQNDGRRATFIPLKESGKMLNVAPFDKAGIIFTEGSEGEDTRTPFSGITTGIAPYDRNTGQGADNRRPEHTISMGR